MLTQVTSSRLNQTAFEAYKKNKARAAKVIKAKVNFTLYYKVLNSKSAVYLDSILKHNVRQFGLIGEYSFLGGHYNS